MNQSLRESSKWVMKRSKCLRQATWIAHETPPQSPQSPSLTTPPPNPRNPSKHAAVIFFINQPHERVFRQINCGHGVASTEMPNPHRGSPRVSLCSCCHSHMHFILQMDARRRVCRRKGVYGVIGGVYVRQRLRQNGTILQVYICVCVFG